MVSKRYGFYLGVAKMSHNFIPPGILARTNSRLGYSLIITLILIGWKLVFSAANHFFYHYTV